MNPFPFIFNILFLFYYAWNVKTLNILCEYIPQGVNEASEWPETEFTVCCPYGCSEVEPA